MQINDTRKVLNKTLEKIPIANITMFTIARIASSLFTIATLTNLTNKKQSNNKEPRLEPVCWQCGTARGLLKVHTAQAEHFVCHSCGGEQ